MIDKDLVKRNQKRLLAEKKRLERLLSRVARQDAKRGSYRANYPEFGDKEDENAAEVALYETNIAEERDLEGKLHKIKNALKRIEKSTYGFCQKGGEEIPLGRLQAVPEAENCIQHEQEG